jgi:AcrR family transcriptional regulator
MAPRLRRPERTGLNRALVLAAARAVFVRKGFEAASLDEIAEEAGFSKGVIYSQFGSKADLFFALLEERIAERASQNARLLETIEGAEGVVALARVALAAGQADPGWALLVTEFRVRAARVPGLNERYACLHRRTVAALAASLGEWYRRQRRQPPVSLETLVHFILALDPGMTLEQAADPGALPAGETAVLLAQLVAGRPDAGDSREVPVQKARS